MFFYPLTLNIALIHSRLFRLDVLQKQYFFRMVKQLEGNFLFYKLYLLSVVVYIFCGIFDYFRVIIFKIFKVRELSLFIENIFPKLTAAIFREKNNYFSNK